MAKILVVEDEQAIADSLRDWLLLEAHKVDVAADGESAWDFLQFNEYDVILLDVMLPRLDGFELCKRYRKNGGSSRILMLTAKNSIEDKEQGLDCGADDYISKPFDLKEVSARIRALMRRSLSVVGSQLMVADLVLDPNEHTVTRGENKIELFPQEFALLEFLMRQPNRIFSAELLTARVWRGSASIDTVRTHIKTLRKKIDLPGMDPLIKTVRGVGYSISAN